MSSTPGIVCLHSAHMVSLEIVSLKSVSGSLLPAERDITNILKTKSPMDIQMSQAKTYMNCTVNYSEGQ